MLTRYTIGVDFGTLSGRAVLLNAESGEAVASSSMAYPHGVMEHALPNGTPLPPQFALQHPRDYIEVLAWVVRDVMKQADVSPEAIMGLGIDFTTCTLLPIREDGTPLCFEAEYEGEPHAYVKLWKHHGGQAEAERTTEVAKEMGEGWLAEYGGRVSSEWAIPKIMETLNRAPGVYEAAARFIDAGDWLSLLLTGQETHAAGFASLKFFWGYDRGYPSPAFFKALDPRLEHLIGTKIPSEVQTVEEIAGVLSVRGAEMTGLREGTPLALPIPDAVAAMPALNITKPGVLMAVVGTSGVQLIHAKESLSIAGICGQIRNGVVPGLYTYEAGQSAVGDIFDWFVRHCVPASYYEAAHQENCNIHQYLRARAQKMRAGESGLLALDWLNGNRSLLQDADVSGMILGLTITTRPEEIYRALIESTAYGVRAIVDAFEDGGLSIGEIRASGGIAKKDPMMMQIYADVLGRELAVIDSDQSAAHGAAIYAAVAAGLYPTLESASEALSVKEKTVYRPIAENGRIYSRLYAEYKRLYDYFGRGENNVMKRLRRIAEGEGNHEIGT